MSITLIMRLTRVALLAGFALPAAALMAQPSQAAPPAPPAAAIDSAPVVQAPVAATDAETIAQFKEVLAQYGNFVQLAPYGEVWVPTVTPEGWHPYPPCHWIYTQDVGWYFRDDTPWGAIVHHYGRWSHDPKIGWFWVPDADWSPGWVVWRDSADYTGWAPMPPDQEAQQVSLDTFNKDKMWIFMETPVFMKGCGGTVLASAVYDETEPVNIFELPRGYIVKVRIVPRWRVKVIRRIIVVDRPCRRRPHHPPPRLVPVIPPTHLTPVNPRPTRTLYDSLQPGPSRTLHRIERHRHHVYVRQPTLHLHPVVRHPRRHVQRPTLHRLPVVRHRVHRVFGHPVLHAQTRHTLTLGKIHQRRVGKRYGMVPQR